MKICYLNAVFLTVSLVVLSHSWDAMGREPELEVTETGRVHDAPEDERGQGVISEIAPSRTEFGLIPAVAYDSDLGLGFGALAVIARLSEDRQPFDWRLQILAYATVKVDDEGANFPFHADDISIDIPGFLDPRLRLNGSLSFRKFADAGYYGFGSRSLRLTPESDGVPDDFHQYDRIYPGLSGTLRWQLIDIPVPRGKRRLEIFGGTRLLYNDFTVYEGSALERDLIRSRVQDPDGATLRHFLRGTSDHALWVLSTGLLLDTRDHEFAPTRGTFTEVSARFSPGVQDELTYGGFTASSSWYLSLYKERLVLASRVAGDIMVGTVPFYELSSLGAFSPTDGPGGGGAVRSVLRQRYAGKTKVLAGAELRGQLISVKLFKQKLNIGGVAFSDVGRVWADFSGRELGGVGLDGDFLNFSTGVGGGLRFQYGETMVIRADYAYSPSDGTTGFYIDIGQAY